MKNTKLAVWLLAIIFSTTARAQDTQKYWIFFKDKGPVALAKAGAAMNEARSRLAPRAIQRRLKVRPAENLVDMADVAVYQPYVDTLRRMGVHIRTISRWLNAVSATTDAAARPSLEALPFVERMQPVRKLAPPLPEKLEPVLPRGGTRVDEHALDYGASLTQNEQIRITSLHDAGIFGEGVVIGMLDAGFNVNENPAFKSLEVLGQFDFVFNDEVTADEPGKDTPGAQSHGTQTLSVIAGFAPGNLIGGAFQAKFYLSKTEDIRSERIVEEDNWVAGIEWMEAQGIDVASSSLGYTTFDDAGENHTFQDLDGNTAPVSIAAQKAVEKGVVVVNSAGNEGNKPWRYVVTPADARDVLAAGAVTASGARVAFSSQGPTADGRIKPDVMAMGAGVTVANPTGKIQFGRVNGTSFSCPLVASVAALVLSAHPHLTPLQVNEAIRMTASQANAPDTLMGYGLVNAVKAATYWGPAFSNRFDASVENEATVRIETRVLFGEANESGDLQLNWRVKGGTSFAAQAMTQQDSTLFVAEIPKPQNAQDIELYFSVTSGPHAGFTHPFGAPAQVFSLNRDSNLGTAIPEEFEVAQNYPNPFRLQASDRTIFALGLPREAVITAVIYNILGQEVLRIADDLRSQAGVRTIAWNGRDRSGMPVGSGIYFLKIEFRQPDGRADIFYRKITTIR